jgi:biopolymer transport protein ExbD
MKSVIALLILFYLFGCHNVPESLQPRVPKKEKGKNIMVTVDGNQQIFIDSQWVDRNTADSFLVHTIRKSGDKPGILTVVINADTAAKYGIIFSLLKSANKAEAKTVVNVNQFK